MRRPFLLIDTPYFVNENFTIRNAPEMLKETGNIFFGVLGRGMDMVAAIANERQSFG